MSEMGDAAGNDTPGRKVELMCAVRWRGHGFLGFEWACKLVHDTSGPTVDDVFPVVSDSFVSSCIEDDND